MSGFITLDEYLASNDIFNAKWVSYPSKIILSGSDVSWTDNDFLINSYSPRYRNLTSKNWLENYFTSRLFICSQFDSSSSTTNVFTRDHMHQVNRSIIKSIALDFE